MDYKRLIIEMIEKMENLDFLEKIFYYVKAKYNRENHRAGN